MRYTIFPLIILLTSAIWSCRSVKYVPVESGTDSVVVEKLVEVPLPSDSATIRALMECDENGKVILRWLDIANSKNAQAQLTIDSLGNLLAKMKTKPDTVYVPGKMIKVEKKVPVIVEVEKTLNRWQQFRLDFGGWAIGIVIFFLLILVGRIIYLMKK